MKIIGVLLTAVALLATSAWAGIDEGLAAYQRKNYREALQQFRPLAEQGNAKAQFALGVMYDNGQGVPQDYAQAAVWYRKAAEQGYAAAQSNLGVMYTKGQGVARSRVVAYALYNLSASIDASADNKATANRSALLEDMSQQEIDAGQALTRDMSQPGNLLKVLDAYIKKPKVKEVAPRQAMLDDDMPAPAADGFPPRPAKRPGVVSCNTNCTNADCWRTYDSGRKVRFRAKQVFDPFSGQFKFDSGNC